ncbi:MAG: ScyD/ScyE family protein [Calothrix sp. C42_A2020_038]|nr:ScyD/ScyE family protein [Calothrix sp. C42_A2020_038]
MKLRHFTLTFFSLSVAVFAIPKVAEAASLSLIADGLNNPRNFDFASDGSIYLTESGRGGDGNGGLNCIPSPSAQYIPLCSGNTGSLLRITPDGQRQTIIPNLTSIALQPSGEQAAGPADFKFDSKGNAYLLTGVAGNPESRDAVLQAPDLGRLYKVDLNTGSLSSIADFAQYEVENNVDGTDLISNPYAFTILNDYAYVVDGGANTISQVALDGSGIKKAVAFPTLQTDRSKLEFPSIPPIGDIPGGGDFPGNGLPAPLTGELVSDPSGTQAFPITFQSVPTGITVAPDGNLTVSEYSYFPYPEGEARIFSVDPNTLQIQEKLGGFTQLTGVTYDNEGNLYALQHINTSEWKEILQGGEVVGDIGGSIIKIAADGTRETILSGNGLEAASGLFFGPDGNLYTSNRARLAETGSLVRIDLKKESENKKVPEPATVISLVAISALGATKLRKRKQQEELGEELLAKVEIL